MISQFDVFLRIRAACKEAGSQRAWADSLGVSQQLVCDVLNARREPSDAMLRAVGVRKVTGYAELSSAKVEA